VFSSADSPRTRARERQTDRRIIALGIPALGTLAIEPLYRLVDTAIVGRIGTEELAGLAVAVAVLSLVLAGSNFLTYGTTERVARRLAARQPGAAADVGVQAIWLSVIVAVAVTPVLLVAARPLVGAFGADGAAAGHGTVYLQISAVGVPFVLVTLAAQGSLRGAADYRTPLAIVLAANLFDLVLEVLLVFVLDLGIAGAAWSTVAAQAAAAIAFVVAVRRQLRPARQRAPSWTEMSPLVTAGKHLLLRVGSMLAVLTGATALAARVDDETLAAHQVTITLFTFLALVLDALSVPAQTLVADALGDGGGDGGDAAMIARRVTLLSTVAGAVLGLVVAALSPVLPSLFSDDADVRSLVTTAMLLLAVMLVPGGVAFAGDGVLIGAGDYRFLGLAALGYLVAVAPIGAVVLATPGAGITAIWLGLVAWMCLRAAVNLRRVHRLLPLVR
jgi:putative MATE family efflux protein